MAVVSDYSTSILAHLGSLLGVCTGKLYYVDLLSLPQPYDYYLQTRHAQPHSSSRGLGRLGFRVSRRRQKLAAESSKGSTKAGWCSCGSHGRQAY